jgi:hypothetical protein
VAAIRRGCRNRLTVSGPVAHSLPRRAELGIHLTIARELDLHQGEEAAFDLQFVRRLKMKKHLFMLALAAALTSIPHIARAADAAPKFDIARNCRAEVADAAGIGETLASCTKDEEQARDELTAQWSQFARDDKTACLRETSADGTPSYVELETCLEMTHLKGRP